MTLAAVRLGYLSIILGSPKDISKKYYARAKFFSPIYTFLPNIYKKFKAVGWEKSNSKSRIIFPSISMISFLSYKLSVSLTN